MDSDKLQRDKNHTGRMGTWHLMCNVEKCEVMHLGRKNEKRQDRTKDTFLRGVQEKWDMEMLVDQSD